MKNYRITVNGISYDVCVEELAEGTHMAAAPPSPVHTPIVNSPAQTVSTPSVQPQKEVSVPPSANSFKINAPMPGKIVGVKVNVGDKVSENQVVVILEAMKMENEIVTPKAGTVSAINVAVGSDVNSGDVLIAVTQ